MGWYYDYKPYVSVAERRRQAQREMEKRRKKGLPVAPIVIDGRAIAKTFWGKAWCDNLESYSDYANRLPRGRTYVRNGSVVHLEIAPGKIKALVSGSELYEIEIDIAPLPAAQWKAIKKECAGQIGSLVELLQGRLSKGVMDVVTRRGSGLFPKPSEITLDCSCPDWADMCKHVAAVLYGVGARLDTNPELLFVLRKVDHLELIAGVVESAPAGARGKAGGKKRIAAGDLSDVFGIEMAEEEAPARQAKPAAKPLATKAARAVVKQASTDPTGPRTAGNKAPKQSTRTKKATPAKSIAAPKQVASKTRPKASPVANSPKAKKSPTQVKTRKRARAAKS